MTSAYKAPDVRAQRVTAEFARDELLRCLESANKEFFKLLGEQVPDEELRGQVRQFVSDAFRKQGVSFDTPTKRAIIGTIEEAKKTAESTVGTKGAEIIQHHYDEIMRLVSKLTE